MASIQLIDDIHPDHTLNLHSIGRSQEEQVSQLLMQLSVGIWNCLKILKFESITSKTLKREFLLSCSYLMTFFYMPVVCWEGVIIWPCIFYFLLVFKCCMDLSA